MGAFIEIKAADGATIRAYRAEPAGPSKGGVVVVQEIFGVNHHIRAVTERVAGLGYVAIAPALFDRFAPGFECGYSPDEVQTARALMPKVEIGKALLDVDAAKAALGPAGPIGILGFCFGGTIAWLAATRLSFDAAVGYYGGQIAAHADETPRCPTMLHFGDRDAHIPPAAVETIRARHPDLPIHGYDAEHGFSCDERASYDSRAAELAWTRTAAFLAETLMQTRIA